MDATIEIILVVTGCIVGFVVSYLLGSKSAKTQIDDAKSRAIQIVEDAKISGDNLKREKELQAKDEFLKNKKLLDDESQIKREKLQNIERQIKQREENIEKNASKKLEQATKQELQAATLLKEFEIKATAFDESRKTIEKNFTEQKKLWEKNADDEKKKITDQKKELEETNRNIENVRATIEQKKKIIDELVSEQNTRLERISGMSREDAKTFLIENMINDAKNEAAQRVKNVRDQAKLDSKKESQRIIIQAIQRSASDYSVETTVSVVNIQGDEMKGRIIGREGRNIRAFEAATGVDVVVDDTPDAVTLSNYDPFRREVARISLERLMHDGRIHPTRIEEVVDKVRKELEEDLIRTGQTALLELGINNVHPEIVRLIGRMKYRSSYGQNVLSHSIETAYIAATMARELGLDANLAKRAGLMHDMGKCVERNIEGPHAIIGFEIAKRCKENPVICNAIGAHHEEMEMTSPISVLVQAADSISGARPGARREAVEQYVKRLETLENIARSFEGVAKTYAIQAGREVRVVVEPDRVDDLLADSLSNDIAKKIQDEMEYPGQIKVTVIREKRAVAFAK